MSLKDEETTKGHHGSRVVDDEGGGGEYLPRAALFNVAALLDHCDQAETRLFKIVALRNFVNFFFFWSLLVFWGQLCTVGPHLD